MKHDLDQHVSGLGVDELERIDLGDAVLELDAFAHLLAHTLFHGAVHLDQVGLGHLVGGVGQAVGEFAVVGE